VGRLGARTRGLEEDHEAVRLVEVVLEQVQAALREAIPRLVHARLVKPEIRRVQAEQSQPALAPDGCDNCHHERSERWDEQEDEGRPDIEEEEHHADSA
jgi:hypothetical protein